MGLEMEQCVVDEDVGELIVCVVVSRPLLDCPILYPFDAEISTSPDTAGIILYMGHCCNDRFEYCSSAV